MTDVLMREQAVSILDEARKAVGADRSATHGPILDNMAHIAALWSAYLEMEIKPIDVPVMMALMKISRAKVGNASTKDHWVDLAGYAAIAGSMRP